MTTRRKLATVVALALAGAIAHAQSAPMMVHYQGRLTQPNGLPLTTPTAQIRLQIFPAASGGTSLWDSGYRPVVLRNGGIFSVTMGDTSSGMPALTQFVFQSGVVYLEVTIQGQAQPMGPRQPIVSVPWSILSQQASLALNVVDGAITTTKLANGAVTNTKLASDPASLNRVSGGYLTVDGTALGLGTSTPDRSIDVVGDSPSTGMQLENSAWPGAITLRGSGAASFDMASYINFEDVGRSSYYTIGMSAGHLPGDLSSLVFATRTGEKMRLTQGGALIINGATTVGSHALTVYGDATKRDGGTAWSSWSDARLKRDLGTIDAPLERLLGLQGRTYAWTDTMGLATANPGRQMGFIAQDVERVFPSWVTTASNGYKLFNPKGFDALTVEAIREQQGQIEALRRENAALRARLADQDRKIDAVLREVRRR